MKYCFVVCDHGLGHTRRVASVVKELGKQAEHSITVLADKNRAKLFDIESEHFETSTTLEALVNGSPSACRWHLRLPDLDGYDVVVSDNLPEVLEVREDSVLMGSFLWHLAVENVDKKYRARAERLLDRHCPYMIGSGLFASPAVRSATRYIDVGLFRSMRIPNGKKTDLLISCGYSDECLDETRGAIESLLDLGSLRFETVFVEPRILPERRPDWMLPADFSPGMFSTLAAAVVRPGIGTLTNMLQAGGRIFCFFEDGNDELRFNAGQIERYGFGSSYASAEAALQEALDERVDLGRRSLNETGIGMEGAAEAARCLSVQSRFEARTV